jgi:SOS-response transcriptional repressor LexA
MEDVDAVECYVATDRQVGFTIPYEYENNPHQYVPDFVVRMRGGKHVLLEIKGRGGELWSEDRVLAKNAAARKWVAAVNNAKRWGEWEFEICRDLAQLRAMLGKHAVLAADAKVLLFRIVIPNKGEHFRTCVPLSSLRAAAGRFSEEQAGFDDRGEWADEWITWDGAPKFEPGMFVARVIGDSMEPEIPSGSYCLFRAPRAGSRQGRKLLVWHSGISDPHTGGQYTLKVYTSEKSSTQEDEWHHTQIILKPLNPKYEPIVLTPRDENEVRIIAEFVRVIGKLS